jgi:hypothetical protein
VQWTADLRTRYLPDVVKGVMRTYEDPQAKRMKKGRAAIPPRYLQTLTMPTASSNGPLAKRDEAENLLSA